MKEIGQLIASAMDKVGKIGIINVDESNSFDNVLEINEGMQYDKDMFLLIWSQIMIK